MSILLPIGSSPSCGRPVSRELTREFVSRLARDASQQRGHHAEPKRRASCSCHRGVGRRGHTPAESRSPEQQAILAPSDRLFAELEEALRPKPVV